MPVLAYFITCHTYGTWLHGRPDGSVDDEHNVVGTPFAEPSAARRAYERDMMSHDAVVLDAARRAVVERTIAEVAKHRGWEVLALHVRTTHVHAVVRAPQAPERVMNDLKSWCTRRMVEAGLLMPGVGAWSRHGSTRWINDHASLKRTIEYTLFQQGAALDGGGEGGTEETPP